MKASTVETEGSPQQTQDVDHAVYTIAQEFAGDISVADVVPYGSGNVNDTYLVRLATAVAPIGSEHFVLQRVNKRVFHQPDLILKNMRTFLDHIAQRLGQNGTSGAQSVTREGEARAAGEWRMPRIIPTRTNQDVYLDQQQEFWRAITLVDGAKTYPRIRDVAHAYESGYALGRFHSLLSDLPPAQLHDTLPGFHITPQYITNFDAILRNPTATARRQGDQRERVAEGLRFIEKRRTWVTILEDAAARGELTLRSIHGDPKVDNILIDNHTSRAISMIDLDTVKPGLVHYDIGDCLRSCCNPAGEETMNVDEVVFDMDLCRAILTGYFSEAAGFFTPADYAYVYDSIRLITFELGLRFFTDYLAGDVYFKTRYPEHNLQRALVQFQLVSSIEAQERAIRDVVTAQQVK